MDRLGYGASNGLVGESVRVARQVPIILDLIDHLRALGDVGAGVSLMGHSMGSTVALHVAAADRAGAVAGMEISGLPLVFRRELVDRDELGRVDYLPELSVEHRRALFYGPDSTYDPDVLTVDTELTRPIPAAEIIDAVNCPNDTPDLATSVVVPVQYTLAEFENSSVGGREVLERAASLFTVAPRVVAQWQVASGHNISLHRVARAYHLRAIAFFDEVLESTA